jgi:hypothetical protein
LNHTSHDSEAEANSLVFRHFFLNGDLVEEIDMKIPKGYAKVYGPGKPAGKALRLQKSTYGLVHAVR